MFPEIREIVNDDPMKDEENKIKLLIPNVNTIFSELNNENLFQELKFLMGSDELLDEAPNRFGHLNTSNCAYINYLSSSSRQDLLERNKVKIHLESGDIFINDNNSKESIYFLSTQKRQYKALHGNWLYDLEDWRFYINDYLANITDDKSDMLTHVNSKFLFYNFNNYQNLIGEETQKV